MNQNFKFYSQIENKMTEPVRDPLWKHIYFTPELLKIAGSSTFQKTARIKQLGPTFHIYPGAIHTRMSHSIGVYEIARQILKAVTSSQECPDLSLEGMISFLCAALLHDIGHFPYTHSLKDLPLKDHEVLSGEIILNTELAQMITTAGGSPEYTSQIIDTTSESSTPEITFYRQILSGVLDPDKMDYLNRDAFFCGVPYGIQDKDFIIDRIVPDPVNGLALDIKGISAVENILFSKYLMYKSIYWHKTVRNITATVKKVLTYALENTILQPEQLYELDDFTFTALLSDHKYDFSQIIENISNRRLYQTAFGISGCSTDRKISSIEKLSIEKNILEDLSSKDFANQYQNEFIIDIPEPVSFETNLRVYRDGDYKPIIESDYVFSENVIKRFKESLSKIRFFYSDSLADYFSKKNITPEIITEKFMQHTGIKHDRTGIQRNI